MLEKFLFTCNAVLPIVLVIFAGYALKRAKVLPTGFFPLLNKLSFRCCLPCLLFYNVYSVQNITEILRYTSVVVFAVISILIFYALGFFVSVISTKDPRQRGVLLQAAFRSNYAIIGISLASSLCAGDFQEPVVVASILSSVSIPLFNILATVALTVFIENNGRKKSVSSFFSTAISIFVKICKNPLIQGVLLGMLALLVRFLIPEGDDGQKIFTVKRNLPFIYKTLQMLATSASTIALLALGGNFEFSAVSRLKRLILVGTFMRVIICPAACLFAAYRFGFRSLEFPALIALYGTPIAVSSVPMAAEMGNDSELAGQLVVWTTLASAFTLFATIFACTSLEIIG